MQGEAMGIPADLLARAEHALAKGEIHDLLMAHARAVDRADTSLLASLWHADAEIDLGDAFRGSAEAYSTFMADLSGQALRTAHTVSNEWVVVDGDAAQSESYVIAIRTVPGQDADTDTLTGGRHLDRFERRDGTWKFTHHRFVLDWVIEQPSTDQRDEPDSIYASLTTRGGRFPDDPVYAFWD